ncbi:MAG: GAF domain-containing protein, partial [Deltaproteobacteria bacterium]|nr:GAF domain-containing protein [Deltaproteobacteria bacterium]
IYDATTDPRLENHEEKKVEGIASILVVPVMLNAKAIGVLSLYSSTHREFTEDEAAFQTALAEQGAIAIQRARLVERINQNLTFFYDLASTINSSLDIKKILHILTSDVAETLHFKGVDIRLWNKDNGSLDLVASYGLSEEFVNRGPITPEHGIPNQVLQGQTVVIRDVRTDKGVQFLEETLKEGLVGLIIVPITAHGEVIGTMGLHSDVVRDYPDDVIKLANALAHQGGLAIHNASMYLLLQEDKKSLERDIWSHRSWF